MRYIDADQLIKKIYPMGIGDGMYVINAKAVKFAIDNTPTADVVPKSEVDRLNAVMKEMDEQRAYTINMLGESLEKAKAEVEEISGKYEDLKLKYADLQKDKDELIAWGNDEKTEVKLDFTEEEIMRSLREAGIEVSDKSISEIKAEVAREIFEEFGKMIKELRYDADYSIFDMQRDFAELKKKYKGESDVKRDTV